MPSPFLRLRHPFPSGLALAATLAGCPSTTTSTTDAAVAPDAFVPAIDAPAPTVDAHTCDLSPVPSPLPMLTGTFVVEGPGNMPPDPVSSGDPVGTFVFDRARFFVSETAATNFDASMSRVEGTAWLALDGTESRLSVELTTTLAGTPAGTIVRETVTHVVGTYELVGTDVTFTPSCIESAMSGGSMPATYSFGVEGDAGMLVIVSSGMLGPVTIVLEGTRQP